MREQSASIYHNLRPAHLSTISLLEIHAKEILAWESKDICTMMFAATLLGVAKKLNNLDGQKGNG